MAGKARGQTTFAPETPAAPPRAFFIPRILSTAAVPHRRYTAVGGALRKRRRYSLEPQTWPGKREARQHLRRRLPLHRRARFSSQGFFPQRRFRIAGIRPSARCCANGDGILLNRKHGRENARPGDVLRRRRPPHRRACLHSRDSSRQRRFRVASKRFCRWDVSQAAAAFS